MRKSKKIITGILAAVLMIFVILGFSGINFNRLLSGQGILSGKTYPKYKAGKNLTFFVTNDIHYLSKDLTDNGEAFQAFVKSGDGKQLGYIEEITDAFINEVKQKKPDVLIIDGDLTNNGEKKSHEDLAQKLEQVKAAGTLVYVVPGNHDINNPWARSFKGDKQYKTDFISDKDFSTIYGDFGYNTAASRDKNSLSYLAEPSEDVWLLMLDTAQYKDNMVMNQPETDGEISKETFDWIKTCSDLAKSKGAQLIAVMHHSLMDHSPVVRKGFTLNNNDEAIQKFSDYGIPLTLTGHIHIQDISSHEKRGLVENKGEIYDIATSALSVYPQQYGVLKYLPKEAALDYSTSKLDVNAWARKVNSKDENLLNFTKFSEEAFAKRAFDMAFSKLSLEEIYSDDQLKEMCKTVGQLNLSYFRGTLKADAPMLKASEGYKLFESNDDSFYKNYVMSLSRENILDGNKLHIMVDKRK